MSRSRVDPLEGREPADGVGPHHSLDRLLDCGRARAVGMEGPRITVLKSTFRFDEVPPRFRVVGLVFDDCRARITDLDFNCRRNLECSTVLSHLRTLKNTHTDLKWSPAWQVRLKHGPSRITLLEPDEESCVAARHQIG